MSSLARTHWADINEASFVGGMRFLFWVCRVFGRWPFRVVLYPVLLWYVLVKPAARAASADYLRRAGQPHGLGGVLRHFAAFAENILDKMMLWGGLYDTSRVTYSGLQPMLDLIAARKGALLVCSHLGNLDLCRVLSHQVPGLQLTVLVHTRHAESFNRMLEKIDPRSALNLFQVTDMNPALAMQLAERVAAGGFVVIAGDRIPVSPSPRTVQAPFFGADAPFPVGPYVLANALQCPAYMLFADGGDQPGVHFELLAESVRLPRSGRDAALAALAQRFAARLEHHCRRQPLQWFNFYSFWSQPIQGNPDASR
jgi:predicted LPLAT superfamily acyltransferase